MSDQVIEFPADVRQAIADRLCDFDWNLPGDEALERAHDIVIDVTLGVHRLLGADDVIERAAIALNDKWAANPTHGAFWPQLEESERDYWRDAVRVVLAAALNQEGQVDG